MARASEYDAVVVGSGPNGLTAAAVLAREGRRVLLVEGKDTIGGGVRSAELTLPGFVHDICSAIHPLALTSPIFQELPLEQHGVEWVQPPAALAHPLDRGRAVIMERSVDDTVTQFPADAASYRKMVRPLIKSWKHLSAQVLGPPLRPPRHPIITTRFGLRGLRSATGFCKSWFETEEAKAAFAGMAAHSILPLEHLLTATFGQLMCASCHTVGWPFVRGGSQNLAVALASYFRSLGGETETGNMVKSIGDLPSAHAYIFDTTPRQLVDIAGDRLSSSYRWRLSRFRYGAAVFKVDFALDGPIPWADPRCARSATAHLGGTLEEISESERAISEGKHPDRPFVLLAQQSLFDPSRAPEGKHAVWAYCHIPAGSTVDMTDRIERQIERFAPGFRDRILARHTMNPLELEAHNPNYVGGDIAGGSMDGLQLFMRPTISLTPYSTSAKDIFICSASTPPGGGVHGMCGYYAARAALRKALRS